MSEQNIERVAIIGAGIAGLAFGACLKQLHTNVREVVIFDSHEDIFSYNVGGALGVSGGAAVLEKIGFLPELKQHGFPLAKLLASYHDEKLMEVSLPQLQPAMCTTMLENGDGAPMIYATRWMKLREVLLQATKEERLPKPEIGEETKEATTGGNGGASHDDMQETRVVVVPKKQLVEITEQVEEGKVTVIFSDESEYSGFDLVVGCDGVKSNTRKFTSHPHETIIAALPFGDYLPSAHGTLDTGVRVMQCVTPSKETIRGVVGEIKEDDKGCEELAESVKSICEEGLRQWCGDGANFLTLAFGDPDDLHYVLAAIYRDRPDLCPEHEDNADWAPEQHHREKVKRLLNDAGYNGHHELHTLLEATCKPGGLIFDLGLQDNAVPLRSWSSHSGRVLLMGDSAHCMSPFLGQGANQAMQDAFSLAALIYEYNHNGQPLLAAEALNNPRARMAFLPAGLTWLLTLAYGLLKYVMDHGFKVVVTKNASRLQLMAYEYERRRKFHAWLITLGSRMMGTIETFGGYVGLRVKVLFFRLLQWTGLVKLLFIGSMPPVV